MSWIESHQSLARHRKTLRAAGLLKTDRHKLIGHLHELWWWGLDNAGVDGQLDSLSAEEIASAAGWPITKAEAFVNALVTAGFIDDALGEPLKLHNWYQYAGKLNEQVELRRQSNRDAQRQRRQRLRQQENDDGHDDSHQPGSDSQHPTVPNLTVPNLTEGSSDPSPAPKRASSKSSKPPADAVQPSEVRYLVEADILRYEAENPTIRIREMIQSYVDWQAGEKSRHRDQIRGFDNQLAEEWRRTKFLKDRPNARPSQPAAAADDDWMAKYNPVEFPG